MEYTNLLEKSIIMNIINHIFQKKFHKLFKIKHRINYSWQIQKFIANNRIFLENIQIFSMGE